MQVYTVHMRRQGLDPHKDIVFVREGFSWFAFVFTFLWAACHRLWLMMAVTVVLVLAMGMGFPYLGLDQFSTAVVQTGFAVVVGYVANDVRRRSLARAGFDELAVVVAKNRTSAEQRFFDQNPAMAQLIEAGG